MKTDQRRYFVGVDLGQAADFTAIAILERFERDGAWDAVTFSHARVIELRLRYLKRVPLGTSYPAVVEQIRGITRATELEGKCHLIVDGSAVGRPVVDMLRQARLGCPMLPVTITGGAREAWGGGHYRVPKRDLVTGLQTLLQAGALQIAAGMAYAPELLREMAEMRVKLTASGNAQYGAWRPGTHDDLVLAVALACWGENRVHPRGAVRADEWERRAGTEMRRILGRVV